MFHWTLHLKGGPKVGYHAAVAVGNKVYTFGGYCDRQANMGQIEVLVFDTVSLRWMTLPPVTTGRGEHPHEVSDTWGHTAVLIEDTIYIWGGTIDIKEYCNVQHTATLYAFDVKTHVSFKPTISGTVPEATIDHSACVLGKVMYVFGGFRYLTGHTNDIHRLDTSTMVWSLIDTRGTPAPASTCHSATFIGTKMFVFGGRDDQDYYNNISVFDTEISCWLNTPSPQLPEGRAFHSAFAYNGELYIFGGDCDWDRIFTDLWKFNAETFSWREVKPKGFPLGPYRMSRMCCCMVGERVVVFGGYTSDNLYILDLCPSLKTRCKLAVIEYGLKQSALRPDIRCDLATDYKCVLVA